MARVRKDEKVKKEKVVVEQEGITGIKEESEQGELFFKVVLILMAVGLFGVIVFFVIDSLIGNQVENNELHYHEGNYITTTHVAQIIGGENFENINHTGLKEALDNYTYVYVVYYAENTEGLTEATLGRQEDVLDIVDQMFELETVTELTLNEGEEDEFTFSVINDDIVIFFIDISNPVNENWLNNMNTDPSQEVPEAIPALLEIFNGEDFNWFGAFKTNYSGPAAHTKLSEVLEGLN